jgi:hypothetical protein
VLKILGFGQYAARRTTSFAADIRANGSSQQASADISLR